MSSTLDVSSKFRPLDRAYPKCSRVSSARRAVARVNPVSRAASDRVRRGCSRENAWMTESPLSRDCTYSVDTEAPPAYRVLTAHCSSLGAHPLGGGESC